MAIYLPLEGLNYCVQDKLPEGSKDVLWRVAIKPQGWLFYKLRQDFLWLISDYTPRKIAY
jgi:hypothetical protein